MTQDAAAGERGPWGPPYAVDPSRPRGLPVNGKGAVVTVGTFDGVHLGHHAILEEIGRRARATGRRSVLVTFDPHPLRIVRPSDAPPLLSTLREKKEILAASPLDAVVFVPFTRTLQHYPARRFVEEILLARVGMTELVIGYDHGFGRDREGSVETLREIGREVGFAVDVVQAVELDGGPISSSRIRRLLGTGDVAEAARLLGRPYAVEGVVVEGERKGRELGYPTANVRVDDPHKMLPAEGIYAAYGWLGGDRLPGLLHLGPRPTFEGFAPSVELHLLDWSGDLYGRTLRVEIAERIRGVERFDSAEALVAAMRRDEEAGRRYFAGAGQQRPRPGE